MPSTFDPSRYTVAEIFSDTEARAYIERNHYSGSYPAARFRFALLRDGVMVGLAVYSVPTNKKALRPLPEDLKTSVELGRLFLEEDLGKNAESWFVARTFRLLPEKGITGVMSFADSTPRVVDAPPQDGPRARRRKRAAKRVVFEGHVGTIYQALNGVYVGRGTRRTLRMLPDGKILNARSLQRIRDKYRGWEHAVAQLRRYGAGPVVGGDTRAWVRRWVPKITEPVQHPGNHKYVWGLTRKLHRELQKYALPYPKKSEA